MKNFKRLSFKIFVITFKNYFTLIKDLCAVFYTVNLSARDGTGTLQKLGAFLSPKVHIIGKKSKWVRPKKNFGPFPPNNMQLELEQTRKKA